MDETKQILRSILVSSPHTINVSKLNSDYKEVVGYTIPYKELGFQDLLAFLHSIPDVLKVQGNSFHSDVVLIVSKKTAHVNDMVLRQKVNKHSAGSFHKQPKKNRIPGNLGYKLTQPPRFSEFPKDNFHKPENCVLKLGSYTNSDTNAATKQLQQILKINEQNKTDFQEFPSDDLRSAGTKHLKEVLKINEKNQTEPQENKSYGRKDNKYNYFSNRSLPDYSDLDIKLKKLDDSEEKLGDSSAVERVHYLRRPNYKTEILDSRKEDTKQGIKDFYFTRENLHTADKNDFMRQLLLNKEKFTESQNIINLKDRKNSYQCEASEDFDEQLVGSNSRVPQAIQNNLKKLISSYPEGIWCSQLPAAYKKLVGKELDHIELGYWCLINMCMDLNQIFICSKESSCDFKLYDAKRPVPKVKIFREEKICDSPKDDYLASSESESALPQLDWNSYKPLMPDDAICLGTEVPRNFVAPNTKIGDVFDVVVAEIYDPSKFWIYMNNGELDNLMDEMQSFYEENNLKYLIPQYLLEVGLNCVVVTLNEYHRAVIVNVKPHDDFVEVFFFDYGSLGTASKSEVWFLREKYSKLPGQAIRTRLADIYPSVESSTWSKQSIRKFRELASMKHVKAKISKIIYNKSIIEVYLETIKLDKSINDILVLEKYALPTSKTRKKAIEDPNCKPQVKFVHLFPTFEEIEFWLVPSVENIAGFTTSNVSADFFFSQYFDRPADRDSITVIEKKTRDLHKRKEKLIKYIDEKQLERVIDIQDINRAIYGASYKQFEADLLESEQKYIDSNVYFGEKNGNEILPDGDDYQNFLNKLRQKHSNYTIPGQDTDISKKNVFSGKIKSSNFDYDVSEKQNQLNYNSSDVYIDKVKVPATKKGTNLFNGNHTYQCGTILDFSEIEKYLSEEEIPSRDVSPTDSKLIDLDDTYSPFRMENFPKKIRSNFATSEMHYTSNRFANLSLATSSTSDIQNVCILDKPIELGISVDRRVEKDSSCSDLIKLDVEIDNAPILVPEIVKKSTSTHFNEKYLNCLDNYPPSSKGNSSDADDERDSDSKLNPSAAEFQYKHRLDVPKNTCDESVQTEEIQSEDNPAIERISGSSQNFNEVESSNQVLTETSIVKTTAEDNSENKIAYSVSEGPEAIVHSRSTTIVGRPPPGFGPIPKYGYPMANATMQYTVYQPWSTATDCATVNSSVSYHQFPNVGNMHMNGMGLLPPQQQLLAQLAYGCPPIVVLNYNGAPFVPQNLPVQPNATFPRNFNVPPR